MTLREYENKLFRSSYELRNKAPMFCRYDINQKIRKKQNEDYQKHQFIKKLLIAREVIK